MTTIFDGFTDADFHRWTDEHLATSRGLWRFGNIPDAQTWLRWQDRNGDFDDFASIEEARETIRTVLAETWEDEGRAAAKRLGWDFEMTGGGCTALAFYSAGSSELRVMATHEGDAMIPSAGDRVLLGYYDGEESEGEVYITIGWEDFVGLEAADWLRNLAGIVADRLRREDEEKAAESERRGEEA